MNKKYRVVSVYKTTGPVEEHCVVGIIESRLEVEQAVKLLQESRIDLRTLSIVGKESPHEDGSIGHFGTGDRLGFWGTRGVFWGDLRKLLKGSAFFLFPVIGPVLVGGSFVSAIVDTPTGADPIEGRTALGIGFSHIGVPASSIVEYESAIKGNRFVMIVQGTSEEVEKAKTVLESFGKQEKEFQDYS